MRMKPGDLIVAMVVANMRLPGDERGAFESSPKSEPECGRSS